jgi:APA family basic amino acid/polyamine antiporter
MAIVVGEVIGSGIFFKPKEVALATGGYVGIILSLWVICGLVNLCGALTLAELSSMFPRAGGTYIFLRETYGRLWAFLWCWAEFWIIRTGAIAALAVYSTFSLQQLFGIDPFAPEWRLTRDFTAMGMIALLGAVNIAGTHWGGRVQTLMTAIKVSFVALLGLLPFIALGEGEQIADSWWPAQADGSLLVGIGAALAAIMWAYDGWGNVTVIAEEVRDPERNVPRALIGGVLVLIVLYFGANLAYHLTLSSEAIGKEFLPAGAVCEKLLPGYGAKLMTAMLLISLFGALNGNILVGPRVLYAVAHDVSLLSPLRRVHPTLNTPATAIALVCAWSMALIVLPDLREDKSVILADWLTNYCIFGGSIFYLSAVFAVFILRKRRPEAHRPYRAWGYPITPAIFVIFYLLFLVSMVRARPQECLLGLTLIGVGLIVYMLMPKQSAPNSARKSSSP